MSRGSDKPGMLCLAGFGDDATLFEPLLQTELARKVDVWPIDLPGFGGVDALKETSVRSLAQFVASEVQRRQAKVIMAHSVASIVATVAVESLHAPLPLIVSLEGNLTVDDAYFSGLAADFEDPTQFKAAFLEKLAKIDDERGVIARYRARVATSDPQALWQLGRDAKSFSLQQAPGERLRRSADVVYIYNPENCPAASLKWLAAQPLDGVVVDGASHWATIDQPGSVAKAVMAALSVRGLVGG